MLWLGREVDRPGAQSIWEAELDKLVAEELKSQREPPAASSPSPCYKPLGLSDLNTLLPPAPPAIDSGIMNVPQGL